MDMMNKKLKHCSSV